MYLESTTWLNCPEKPTTGTVYATTRSEIVGIVEVVKEGYPDFTAFEPGEKYYDPKSDPENPRWYMVDVKLKRKFRRVISLQELKQYKSLSEMLILRRGNRLSITPISKKHWDFILKLENK
jgi:predicted RNA-binding protein with PUA-like domain